ncbi:enoyl-CoA hydratase/isomerase family protein [Mycobacterium montefiorense]|uniref:Enoyl-CoA hydratase/isomerase n=1 Tax=Mycobacterium montefiorense TaxID=154654 RepID=A0AA37PNQ6_9MYCO|nr:enoyl-CoA hydratase/isomerase family protein [Mycobacterium montefiorense]GBG40805.1 putative enoyl-CoA hydratase/isomerase [Mycobacterium montefiorense]GKU36337.1 putative enoyl-CoA hydratase/isomerase [Mycobacterium montefiorense]GKU41852.1 putative enoyl-CoA hydratase/isomerase [Mycobacterium montefiorense]GKU47746.1 putative enoyl-CoA hydratase/isomerase [Mycobacterium montefiorense]GKU52824.1 putative enoyl-CoA hydratase/isomerase [Mycobacterium montefiorense]
MTTDTPITVERLDDGAIAILTINRPTRRNALDSQTLVDMHRLLDTLNGDPTLRAIVVTGTGVSFCSGADLKSQPGDLSDSAGVPYAELRSVATSTVAVTMAAQELMASAFEKVHRLRVPVIAAVNGFALGGGFALALACDIRYAARSATFGAVFIRHGVSACDMGTSYFLPRLVGAARAAELMLTGRVFDAAEAVAIGLVLEALDPSSLLDTAVAKAREIAHNSPLAVWMTKETMWQTIDSPSLRHALDIENRTQVMCTGNGDLANSFAAFRDDGTARWNPL